MKIFDGIKIIIRPVYHLMLISASYFLAKFSLDRASQLEIGSGPLRRKDWITLDKCMGADLFWDLRYKLPFKDGCLNRVYCSHVLEHFSFHELKFLLSEVNRVLIKGGEFLITVPDASIYIDAYLGHRSGATLMKYSPAVSSEKPMDILNYIFYMDGHHKFMFDKENLVLHCERAGFESCVARPFEEGLDLPERDYESLYMSCLKK